MRHTQVIKGIHLESYVTVDKVYDRLNHIPSLTKEEIKECLDKYAGGIGTIYSDNERKVPLSYYYAPMSLVEDYY